MVSFGYDDEKKQVQIFALDRILNIEKSTKKFIANKFIDFEDYFDDIIGVTRTENEVKQKIILHFNPDSAPYVETKPLHPSQKKIKQDANGYTVSIEVIPNYELEQLILSFGASVTVLEPSGFRKKVLRSLQKACLNY
jgi:predicted DNA-binding transcriptional regulator YafY